MKNKRLYGNFGEDFAEKILLKQGYKIIKRNFRCPFGEIDIIAQDKNILVFVEVKTRWSKKYGKPEEAVTPRKLAHIKKTINYYLLLNPSSPQKMRIEVIAIEASGGKVNSCKTIKVV